MHTLYWIIQQYDSFTPLLLTSLLKAAFVGQMYVNGRCLISVLAVPIPWLQENTEKLEKTNCFPIHLPWRSNSCVEFQTYPLKRATLTALLSIFLIYAICSEPQQMSLVLYSVLVGKWDFAACVNRNPSWDSWQSLLSLLFFSVC